MRALVSIAVVLCCALILSVATAHAEIRSGTAKSGRDAEPPLNGLPVWPDAKQVQVDYDTAGSFRIVVDFYNPISALDTSSYYAHAGSFGIGSGVACESISGQNHIAGTQVTFLNQFSVSGFSGSAPLTRTVSNGGTRITLTGASQQVANKDFRCFRYETAGYRYASASDPLSQYSPNCGCWFRRFALEEIAGYFDGFRPGTGSRCTDARRRLREAEHQLARATKRLRKAQQHDAPKSKLRWLREKVKEQKRIVRESQASVDIKCQDA